MSENESETYSMTEWLAKLHAKKRLVKIRNPTKSHREIAILTSAINATKDKVIKERVDRLKRQYATQFYSNIDLDSKNGEENSDAVFENSSPNKKRKTDSDDSENETETEAKKFAQLTFDGASLQVPNTAATSKYPNINIAVKLSGPMQKMLNDERQIAKKLRLEQRTLYREEARTPPQSGPQVFCPQNYRGNGTVDPLTTLPTARRNQRPKQNLPAEVQMAQ